MGWLVANLFFQCSCLLGWYINRKGISARLGWPALMVLVTLVFECIAAYYWLALVKNNLFLFHLLVPIQYTLLVFTYYNSIKIDYLKQSIIGSILLVWLSAIVFALTLQPVTTYNTYTQLLVYLLLTTWSSLYLWNVLTDDGTIPLEREPLFWISIGIIFYSVTNFVITGTLNYLIKNSLPWAKVLYAFTVIVAFIMYTIFTFAFFSPRLFTSKRSKTTFKYGSR